MRTRNGRRKLLFGTNCPMVFHEPALADFDALALDDEARALYLSAKPRLFEGGPRRLLCSASRSEPEGGSGARNGRPLVATRARRRGPARPAEAGASAPNGGRLLPPSLSRLRPPDCATPWSPYQSCAVRRCLNESDRPGWRCGPIRIGCTRAPAAALARIPVGAFIAKPVGEGTPAACSADFDFFLPAGAVPQTSRQRVLLDPCCPVAAS
jgi:hypothetical protein